ncbi:MAG: hypothetical protein R3F62_24885 [Planctomycetota bacterium]
MEAFLASLSAEERLLVRVRDALYEGRWDELREDLVARASRGPSMFTLETRIEDDLARIARLEAFERDHAGRLEFLDAELTWRDDDDTPGQREAEPRAREERLA